jgi:hypothetical protein
MPPTYSVQGLGFTSAKQPWAGGRKAARNAGRLEGREEGRKEGRKEHIICGGSEGTNFVSGCPNKEIGWPILYTGRQADRTA